MDLIDWTRLIAGTVLGAALLIQIRKFLKPYLEEKDK